MVARFFSQFTRNIGGPVGRDGCSDAEYDRHKAAPRLFWLIIQRFEFAPGPFPVRLSLHDELRNFCVIGFRAQSIEFPSDLLAKKFQCASDRLLFLESVHQLAKMRVQTGNFL